ncbi:MAG: hypothetical protein ACR2FM_05490 [Candidatus Saccharimonadales bacterium]
MAIPYTDRETILVMGESAPPAVDVLFGARAVNDLGDIALDCFKANKLNGDSVARLDCTVDPPVIYLKDALTTILSGHTDTETGEFIQDQNELLGSRRVVTGVYSGPGSELVIV